MSGDSGTEVVLVHGLWVGPWTLSRLGRGLRQNGFSTRQFRYAATTDSLEQHAVRLHSFARESRSDRLHFLGHSLGGMVILRMLAEFDDIAPGRILLLGTPLKGSITARKSRRIPGSNRLLGEVKPALEDGFMMFPENRDTGMIAGSRGVGLGLLTGGVGGPGDGTVALSETESAGLKDRIVLPVTHSGMLFSSKVVRQSVHFLDHGLFNRDL